MRKLQADSRVDLDLKSVVRALPADVSADYSGRATWLSKVAKYRYKLSKRLDKIAVMLDISNNDNNDKGQRNNRRKIAKNYQRRFVRNESNITSDNLNDNTGSLVMLIQSMSGGNSRNTSTSKSVPDIIKTDKVCHNYRNIAF